MSLNRAETIACLKDVEEIVLEAQLDSIFSDIAFAVLLQQEMSRRSLAKSKPHSGSEDDPLRFNLR
jgi:hypothetical protein